jgi:flagellar hook-basal body protein
MRARLESLDMLANNIANSSAPGFKADREFFGLYLSQEAAESPAGTDPPVLPVIERSWTDFTQGYMTPTGSPLDLALNGKGFFVANSPSGPVFTRDGSFRSSKNGALETLDGYSIQGADGKPILLDNAKSVEISPDGMVRQGGQDVSRIAIV